jgi:Flp pilus assembly pilin Flp
MMLRGAARAQASARESRRSESGAAAVEFALVLPVLCMLLLGVLTAGLSYSHGLGLTNAVREGSRFGATATPATAGDWTSWADDVIARTRATQFDDPSISTSVCVKLFKNTGTSKAVPTYLLADECDPGTVAPIPSAGTAPAPPAVEPGTCVVAVWAARNFTINALVLTFKDKTMRRQSVARYERTC